ncbi:MAG: SMC-Scp complex subunit ScpB [Zhaonellaceae bacterium]|jgi:segregation and condensation protein B|nr:SMC-Scp complex subunit ScpB [Clostridia bacterium]
MLFSEDKKAIIESLLFVSIEPLSAKKIGDIIGLKPDDVLILLTEIKNDLEKPDRGICLIEIAEGFKIVTKEQYSEYIEKILKPQVTSLSHAALETLAIIAYKQPITRAEIEQIRGVKVDGVLNNLMEKLLIKEIGRKESPGRPIVYGTTTEFLTYFGLKNLSELPSIE